MGDFINTVDILGDEVVTNSIIDGSITEYNDNNITMVGDSVFRYREALTSVNFPNVTTIGNYAFYCCTSLTSVNIPSVTKLDSEAFSYCSALTSVNLPNVNTHGSKPFYSCGIKSLSMPSLSSTNNVLCNSCSLLERADFQILTSTGSNFITYCDKFTSVDLPMLNTLGSSAFTNCKSLKMVILRSTTMCTLQGTNAFKSSLIASGTGYIYVPRALVEGYKTATNWSTYANQFRALEDYTVDGTTTGALDETKI